MGALVLCRSEAGIPGHWGSVAFFAQGPYQGQSQGFVQRGVHGWQTCPTDCLKKSQLRSRLLGDQVVGQVLDDRQPVVKTVPSVNLYVLVVHAARGEQAIE
jgi:hypothetical protein